MGSLREQIREKNAAAKREETVKLPVAGVEVLMIGMKLGERLRVMEVSGVSKSLPMTIALTAHDPKTREPLWNPNKRDDMQEIAALSPEDAEVLAGAASRTSGLDGVVGKSQATDDSSSS